MKKYEKEAIQSQLKDEEKALKELKRAYQKARTDVQAQIKALNARTDMQNISSIVHQKRYQEAILKQIEGVLNDLNSNQYTTMNDFLNGSYSTGYVANLYSLQKQTGCTILTPIDLKKVKHAVETDAKLSKSYYQNRELPENLTTLKRNIQREITRGIVSEKSWIEVAYQVANGMNSPFKKAMSDAMRIVRTEGHRINQQGFLDAGDEAIKHGADELKQWDATLDGVTRPWHREADGQIVEWNDYFIVNGEKMKAPSIGGSASNVINCRCQLLQRARWALDEDELKTLQERAKYFKLDKSKNFEDFKNKFLKASESMDRRTSFPIKPVRPSKRDYTDPEQYESARLKFKKKRAEYQSIIQGYIDEDIARPRKYATKESIKQWCDEHKYRIDETVFKNVDLRIFDDVISVQEEMFEKFPQVKAFQDKYYPYGFSYDENDNFDYVFEASGGLNFGRCTTDYESFLSNVYDSMSTGFSRIGDGTAKTVIRHEFGHNLDHYIKNSIRPLDANLNKSELENALKMMDKYDSELIDLTKKYSDTEYGFTNRAEAFAEGFAEYTSNPDSDYAKAFGEFLGRWLK